MLISAETADEVIQKTEEVVRQLELFLGCNFSDYHMETILWKYFEDKIVWCVTDKNVLDIYAKHGLWSYQFSPDCIVFLGKSVLKLENGDLSIQIAKYREKNGEPVILAYDGKLFIIASSVKKALEIQSVLSFSAQVMDINCDYACNLLSDEQQDELLNWDAEKYRQNIK